jgi:hypothetical protein
MQFLCARNEMVGFLKKLEMLFSNGGQRKLELVHGKGICGASAWVAMYTTNMQHIFFWKVRFFSMHFTTLLPCINTLVLYFQYYSSYTEVLDI